MEVPSATDTLQQLKATSRHNYLSFRVQLGPTARRKAKSLQFLRKRHPIALNIPNRLRAIKITLSSI